MKPITQPDVTRTDQEYWDQVLTSHDLAAERGRPSRIRLTDEDGNTLKNLRSVIHIGGLTNLAGKEQEQYRRRVTGKITRRGKGPDSFEPSDPNEN